MKNLEEILNDVLRKSFDLGMSTMNKNIDENGQFKEKHLTIPTTEINTQAISEIEGLLLNEEEIINTMQKIENETSGRYDDIDLAQAIIQKQKEKMVRTEKRKMKNKFKEFLMERHAEDYTGCGDDIGEAFNEWLCNLGPDGWLNYGDWFGKTIVKNNKEKLNEHI